MDIEMKNKESPKFKIGDRVKSLRGYGSGKIGTITSWQMSGPSEDFCNVTFDCDRRGRNKKTEWLCLLSEAENNQTTNNQSKGKTMKLTQVQKQYTNSENITILEAFYRQDGTLDTSSEEFGLFFMTTFGDNCDLIKQAQIKLAREAEEAKKS